MGGPGARAPAARKPPIAGGEFGGAATYDGRETRAPTPGSSPSRAHPLGQRGLGGGGARCGHSRRGVAAPRPRGARAARQECAAGSDAAAGATPGAGGRALTPKVGEPARREPTTARIQAARARRTAQARAPTSSPSATRRQPRERSSGSGERPAKLSAEAPAAEGAGAESRGSRRAGTVFGAQAETGSDPTVHGARSAWRRVSPRLKLLPGTRSARLRAADLRPPPAPCAGCRRSGRRSTCPGRGR